MCNKRQDSMVSLAFRCVPFGVYYEASSLMGCLDDESTVVPRRNIFVQFIYER